MCKRKDRGVIYMDTFFKPMLLALAVFVGTILIFSGMLASIAR
jgi:uncharacterized membrane protein